MKITVIGVGHVGLITVGCLAHDGHEVVGLDLDSRKIDTLQAGDMPFYEEGLADLVSAGVDAGRITFTSEAAGAFDGSEVVFICVGTPRNPDGSPNLTYVQSAAATLAANATGPMVVAEKSTVPVRTGARIRQALRLEASARQADHHHEVVSNPEFLREGTAVEDTLRPDRVVVGAGSERAHEIMRRVYQPLLDRHDAPYVATDVNTAELIKHASNGFLATKISFINAVARICELAGADVHQVADAMGYDRRIGRSFLNAGLGYGGSCFPKDVEAFVHIAGELGYDFGMLRETERVNREAKRWPLQQLRRLVWNLPGKEIAVLGLAFKPGTDDIREAPALDVIESLRDEGATVRLHDPVAMPHIEGRYGHVTFCESAEEALKGAHAVVMCTEWDEYRELEPARLADLLQYPVVIDARNVWDPRQLEAAGLVFASVGRPLGDERAAISG